MHFTLAEDKLTTINVFIFSVAENGFRLIKKKIAKRCVPQQPFRFGHQDQKPINQTRLAKRADAQP